MTMIYLLSALITVNFATFCTFGWDKFCAMRNRWRVPERTLLLLALVGGSIGALLAQHLLRHKTTKQPFAARLKLIAKGQVALGTVLLALWFIR